MNGARGPTVPEANHLEIPCPEVVPSHHDPFVLEVHRERQYFGIDEGSSANSHSHLRPTPQYRWESLEMP